MESKVKQLPQSRVEIEITLEKRDLNQGRGEALKKLAQEIDIPGFRKGKAPLEMVEERVNEAKILLETLNVLIPKVYQEEIEKHQLEPIAQPAVQIPEQEKVVQKAAEGKLDQVLLKFTVSVRPKVKLEDYSSIKVTRPSPSVHPDEVEKLVQEAFKEWKVKEAPKKEKEISTAKTLSEAEKKGREKQKETKERLAKLEKSAPDDVWAQLIGAQNLQDLRQKVRADLLQRKRIQAEHELEQNIFSRLLEAAEVEIPPELLEQETKHQEQNLRQRFQELGVTLENYLKQRKQTQEELNKELKKQAENTLKIDFILDHIAQKEGIKVSDQEVEKELKQIKDKKTRQRLEKPAQKEYIRYTFRRRKVMDWLKSHVGS